MYAGSPLSAQRGLRVACPWPVQVKSVYAGGPQPAASCHIIDYKRHAPGMAAEHKHRQPTASSSKVWPDALTLKATVGGRGGRGSG
eukprot:359023-Chlamydomonas_euryale.AAC.1